MKVKTDPRHLHRIKLMQDLFSWNFQQKSSQKGIKQIIEKLPRIDKLIKESASHRPLSEINRIDLAILRLAIFELIIERDTPPKVVIDEAIELGKEFGSDSSSSFINGALGQVVKLLKIKI